jgi:hypothetical protein
MLTINIDEKTIENRLDGVKMLADKGGESNRYPVVYTILKETLGFLGIMVREHNGKHTISKRV